MKTNDRLKEFVASGFWLGLMPLVPGSFGALAGLAWHMIAWLCFWQTFDMKLWCLSGALVFAALHFVLTPWAQKHWNDPDPKNFVLDEIVGYLCVPLFTLLPLDAVQAANGRWPFQYIVAAFVVFRILDAIKLPGARYIDRNIHNAWGVILDDVVSAFYTGILLSAWAWTAVLLG